MFGLGNSNNATSESEMSLVDRSLIVSRTYRTDELALGGQKEPVNLLTDDILRNIQTVNLQLLQFSQQQNHVHSSLKSLELNKAKSVFKKKHHK